MPRAKPIFDIMKLIGEESKRYANLPDRYIKRKFERVSHFNVQNCLLIDNITHFELL